MAQLVLTAQWHIPASQRWTGNSSLQICPCKKVLIKGLVIRNFGESSVEFRKTISRHKFYRTPLVKKALKAYAVPGICVLITS
jgi:hypothetical protein